MRSQFTRQKGDLVSILLFSLSFLFPSLFLSLSLNKKHIFEMNLPLPWG